MSKDIFICRKCGKIVKIFTIAPVIDKTCWKCFKGNFVRKKRK